MPLSRIDARAALVVMDLQRGILSLPICEPVGPIVERAAALARAFRARGLPVVWVNVAARAPGRTDRSGAFSVPPGSEWTELSPDLGVEADDILIAKHGPGAFIGTGLDARLRELAVTQVMIAGVATGSGVEATGRSAYDLGYHVVYVTDAMADLDPETHAFCLAKTFPRIGETTPTRDLLGKLEG